MFKRCRYRDFRVSGESSSCLVPAWHLSCFVHEPRNKGGAAETVVPKKRPGSAGMAAKGGSHGQGSRDEQAAGRGPRESRGAAVGRPHRHRAVTAGTQLGRHLVHLGRLGRPAPVSYTHLTLPTSDLV